MSEAYERRQDLVEEATSSYERLAAGIVGVGFLLFILGWGALFEVTPIEKPILGLRLFDLFGVALVATGVGVLAVGALSRLGVVSSTTPSDTAGVVVGLIFGATGFAAGAVVAAAVLGLGTVGTLGLGVGGGGLTAAVTLFTREDVGSTVVPGVAATAIGVAILFGTFGVGWEWTPEDYAVTFTGRVVVPLLAVFAGMLVSWAAAKAYRDFGSRGRETGAYMLIGLNAFGIIALLIFLLLFVASKGIGPLFQGFQVGPGLNFEWPFVTKGFTLLPDDVNGVRPAIVGTVWLVVGVVLIAVPIGVGAALFLTEYAEQGRFTQVVEVATNGLWSTPSIVFGLFGYAFLVPRLGNQPSLLAGMLVLSFMLLPLVIITSREAMIAVPDSYRDASAALGVGQWKTIRRVVLPAAMPGIVTGVILGVGRIAGETAPILLVMTGGLRDNAPSVLAGFEFVAQPPFVTNQALLQSSPALPYQLYAIITAGVSGSQEFGWGTALVLLLVVLSFYAVGIVTRNYFRSKIHHE
jgi:phosphate transport system permease protein